MAIKRVFHSTLNSSRFIFKDGTVAHFNAGKFFTDKKKEIAELEEEIAAGSIYIFMDEKVKEVDVDADPLEAVRKKAIEEFIAANAAAIDPNKLMGFSDQGKLKTVTSHDIAAGAASGEAGMVAKLAALSGSK